MKKSSLIFLFLTISLYTTNAQDVREVSRAMSLGNNPALVVEFEGVSDKLVGKVWEDYLDKYYDGDAKWQRKTKEWFTDNISIASIGGATPVDLHAVAQESGKNVTFSLWVNVGTNFLNSRDYYDQYKEAEKLVSRFVEEVSKEKTRLDLEGQEKQLKQLEKELEKLQSANERYHSDIEKAKEAIRKAEEDIIKNEKDQEATRQKIENQKQVVGDVKKKLDDMK